MPKTGAKSHLPISDAASSKADMIFKEERRWCETRGSATMQVYATIRRHVSSNRPGPNPQSATHSSSVDVEVTLLCDCSAVSEAHGAKDRAMIFALEGLHVEQAQI